MFARLELSIAAFANADGGQRRLYDAKLACLHAGSLAHRRPGVEFLEIKGPCTGREWSSLSFVESRNGATPLAGADESVFLQSLCEARVPSTLSHSYLLWRRVRIMVVDATVSSAKLRNMAHLRIVTWNCCMALAGKARSLLALKPDIAVIQIRS